MQADLFGEPMSLSVEKNVDVDIYPWEQVLRKMAFKSQQTDLVYEMEPNNRITTYKSGASSKADILGYISAGSAIGICVLDSSAPVRKLVAEYVSQGGKVFADSGAFRTFMSTLRNPDTKPINFQMVFQRYEEIIDNCNDPGTLTIVAPDVVGDQDASYRLLVNYKTQLTRLASKGVKVMVPMQKGKLSISEHYRRCLELLGFGFVTGLPSNAEALSPNEVFEFVATVRPAEVHFLGSAESGLVHQAKFKSPGTEFSCDATLLRKHIGKGRLLTEMQGQILGDAVGFALRGQSHVSLDLAMWDETELLGDLKAFTDTFSDREVDEFASRCGIEPSSVKDAEDSEALWQLLDDTWGDYAFQIVRSYIVSRCEKSISPMIRTHVFSELAKRNIV